MAWKDGPHGSVLTRDVVTTWDDQAHSNVKTMIVGHNAIGINLVHFSYRDGGNTTVGQVHGRYPEAGIRREFRLDEDEYITMVIAHTGFCVRELEFQTNKRLFTWGVKTHDPDFIYEVPVTLGSFDSEKVVGFHGKSGNHLLREIGVYWAPI